MARFGFYARKPYMGGRFHKIISLLSVLFSLMLVFAMGMRMISLRSNLDKALESFNIFVTQIAFLIKLIFFAYRLPKFYALEEFLESPVFTARSSEHSRLIIQGMKCYRTFAKFYHACCWSCSLLYLLLPLVDDQVLPITIWFPLEILKYRPYLYVYEICCYVVTSANNPSIDCISVAFLNFTATQLDILRYNLQRATVRRDTDEILVQEAKIRERFKRCAIHHIAIKE